MQAELWAVGIVVTVLLSLFGYVIALHNKINDVKTGAADELSEFREHVANEYAKNGSLENAVNRMVKAMDGLTTELRQFQRDVHTGVFGVGHK